MSLFELLSVAILTTVFALFTWGAWRLHSHFPSVWTKAFIALSVCSLLFAPALLAADRIIWSLSGGNAARALIRLYDLSLVAATVASVLAIALASSFALSVRRLGQRPNNSFKPKPLRGSA